MEHALNELLGLHASSHNITALQMSVRAVVVFFVALLLLRLAGKRTFGSNSPFDVVLKIILGAVLSRAIVAASPFVGTLVASAVMVGLHRLLAMAAYHSHAVGKLIKGRSYVLAENGALNRANMQHNNITERDLHEGVRSKGHTDDLTEVETVRLERDGEISVVMQKQDRLPS
ncbi:DUF421 domain-containing protein [Hymenobacter sp. 15J16-1T3B]|uniref:DUF421 domain-containing protein n=1 Tax=Hymenobacter sp. 15J16-1T3B TaxID=2886941 RepID=UPI001D105C0D|nr:YetF domain-containing protein [Hymenobacter sp. 15J16-1T3B]MCC3157800.1 DUF421 domain-containing protein [Hymenobacter sp. 15J16-1T3B]